MKGKRAALNPWNYRPRRGVILYYCCTMRELQSLHRRTRKEQQMAEQHSGHSVLPVLVTLLRPFQTSWKETEGS
jgi:hypothetical protein